MPVINTAVFILLIEQSWKGYMSAAAVALMSSACFATGNIVMSN